MQQRLRINGMHCGSCTARVTRALETIEGVQAAHVTLPDYARLEVSALIPLRSLQAALDTVGSYTVTVYRLDPLAVLRTFWPLITMFALVIIWASTLTILSTHAPLHAWMQHFMGGFFLLFGGLKVINLRNFASMYQDYDLLAARIPLWGYVYPFVELALGITYTSGMGLDYAHLITIALMSFGALGIYHRIKSGTPQTCACLGGFFSVPLTEVTIAENLLMVAMALFMLV